MEERGVTLNFGDGRLNGFALNGKTAVITGGGSGIGKAIAQRFAKEGATVHLLDINLCEVEATAQEISAAGGDAHSHQCDVGDQQQVRVVFEKTFKTGRVDILVNNAGIAHVGKLETTSEADFDNLIRVNVKGFYNCMLAAVPHFKTHGAGVILNLASIAAWVGLPDRFAYSMSKGAVVAMTYSVAKDYLADNIRCNCISPARVHTPFVDGFLRKNYPGREQEMYAKLSKAQPVGRMAEPHEVAALALFLCSEEAGFITGTDYRFDGGFLSLRD